MLMQNRFSFRHAVLAVVGVSTLYVVTTDALAQSPRSSSPVLQGRQKNRPTVSPYTSLVNDGVGSGLGSSGLNYYNIVRPQQQAQRTARTINNQFQTVESQIRSIERPQPGMATSGLAPTGSIVTGRMSPTGHRTAFGSTGTYFPGR